MAICIYSGWQSEGHGQLGDHKLESIPRAASGAFPDIDTRSERKAKGGPQSSSVYHLARTWWAPLSAEVKPLLHIPEQAIHQAVIATIVMKIVSNSEALTNLIGTPN